MENPEFRTAQTIACIPDDFEICAALIIGITCRGHLVLMIEATDYLDKERSCATWAVVNDDDALAMAKRYKVKMDELPELILRAMEEWECYNASLRYLIDVFADCLERFLDEDCRFRIERTYGKGGVYIA